MTTNGRQRAAALAFAALALAGCSEDTNPNANEARLLAYEACTVPYNGPEPTAQAGVNPVEQLSATADLHAEAADIAEEAAALDPSWSALAEAEAKLAAANRVVAKMPSKVADWSKAQTAAVAKANKSAEANIKIVKDECARASGE
jgi:PBP1b-binding outer membrane lipoprotein LpoB